MLQLLVLSAIQIIGYDCIYFEYIQPFDNEVINTIESLERSFTSAVLENSGGNFTLQSIRSIQLKRLYFHLQHSTIMISEALLSLDEVTMKQMSMDLINRKIALVASFNFVQVDGIMTLKQNVENSIKSKFSLIMDKTTCNGIASTKGNLSNPRLESLYLLSTDYSKPFLEIKSQAKDFARLTNKVFAEILLDKLDRELTYHMSVVMKTRIDQVLKMSNKLARQELDNEAKVLIKNYQIELISNANNLLDNLLKFASDFIQGQFEDRFPVPSLNEKFSVNVLILPIRGSFVASKGLAVGLKSIYRNGNVFLGSGNDSLLHFYGGLGFRNLRVKYNYYRAELIGLGPTGTVDVKIAPLKVLLYVRINTSGPAVNLEEFKITNLGDVQVSLTGFGAKIDWLVSMATVWIFGLFRDQIIRVVEGRISDVLNKTLQEGNFNELLGGEGILS